MSDEVAQKLSELKAVYEDEARAQRAAAAAARRERMEECRRKFLAGELRPWGQATWCDVCAAALVELNPEKRCKNHPSFPWWE